MKKTLLFLTIVLFSITSYPQEQKEIYFNNGNLKAVYQTDENGKETGECKIYYENEQLLIVGEFH